MSVLLNKKSEASSKKVTRSKNRCRKGHIASWGIHYVRVQNIFFSVLTSWASKYADRFQKFKPTLLTKFTYKKIFLVTIFATFNFSSLMKRYANPKPLFKNPASA
jgi:hypothetical protein